MTRNLNIPAIEQSLLRVKREFCIINECLSDRRDPLTDTVIANMIDGYRLINTLFDQQTNPLKLGQSGSILELNHIVLCGGGNKLHNCNKAQVEAANNHFYGEDGCLSELMEWLAINNDKSVWFRAAGMFSNILSQPQLFIEGNHRTATLLISFLLVSHGEAPCVLTVENASFFFEQASLIKKKKKFGLDRLIHLPRLTQRFAEQLKKDSDASFLL